MLRSAGESGRQGGTRSVRFLQVRTVRGREASEARDIGQLELSLIAIGNKECILPEEV